MRKIILTTLATLVIQGCSSGVDVMGDSTSSKTNDKTTTTTTTTTTTFTHNLPDVGSREVSVDGKIVFFKDSDREGHYWFIPVEIDPVARDGKYSVPIIERNELLYFSYMGQVRVPMETLEGLVKIKNTKMENIHEIMWEEAGNAECPGIDKTKIDIELPPRPGSFHEYLGASVTSSDPASIEMLKTKLREDGAIKCFYQVQFEAVQDKNEKTVNEKLMVNLYSPPEN